MKQLSGDKTREQLRRERYLAEMQADANDRRHGTLYGYSVGCRCRRCKTARYNRDKRAEDRIAS